MTLLTVRVDIVMRLLLALADGAPDGAALAYLGAGPIEDLLGADAANCVDAIDEAARRNERFRTALRCASFDHHVAPAIAERLRRFGPPI